MFIGSYVRVVSLPDENYGKRLKRHVGHLSDVFAELLNREGTSTNGVWKSAPAISDPLRPTFSDGVAASRFRSSGDIEVVAATEEMLPSMARTSGNLSAFGESRIANLRTAGGGVRGFAGFEARPAQEYKKVRSA